MKRWIERFDLDRDGRVEDEELAKVGKLVKQGLHVKELRERLERDTGGSAGAVEKRRAKRIHDRADVNKDGRVGPKERKIVRRKKRATRRKR